MRYVKLFLFFAALALACSASYGQGTPVYTGNSNTTQHQRGGYWVDSVLLLPSARAVYSAVPMKARAYFDSASGKFYINNGTSWVPWVDSSTYARGQLYVNVKDYGAVGDGATNDRVAFNNAIATGHSLFVPDGVYLLNGTGTSAEITLNAGQSVRGAGIRDVVLTTTDDKYILLVNDSCMVSTLSVRGTGKFDFSKNTQSGIVTTQHNGGIILENIYATAFRFYGIAAIGFQTTGTGKTYQNIMNNIVVDACGTGIGWVNRAEYWSNTNVRAHFCTRGAEDQSGNNVTTNFHYDENDTGFVVRTGTNNGHGELCAGTLNHNNNCALYIDSTRQGYDFNGCFMYNVPVIIKNSTDINFSGGIMATPMKLYDNDKISLIGVNRTDNTIPDTAFTGSSAAYISADTASIRITPKFLVGNTPVTSAASAVNFQYSELPLKTAQGTYELMLIDTGASNGDVVRMKFSDVASGLSGNFIPNNITTTPDSRSMFIGGTAIGYGGFSVSNPNNTLSSVTNGAASLNSTLVSLNTITNSGSSTTNNINAGIYSAISFTNVANMTSASGFGNYGALIDLDLTAATFSSTTVPPTAIGARLRLNNTTATTVAAVTASANYAGTNTNTTSILFYAPAYTGAGTKPTNFFPFLQEGSIGINRFEALTVMANYYSISTAPSIAAGAGAGTGPTIAIAGTNARMKVTLTPGTTPSASATIATITFSSSFAYPADCKPIIAPGNELAATLSGTAQVYCVGSTASFTINSNTVALAAGEYVWYISTSN